MRIKKSKLRCIVRKTLREGLSFQSFGTYEKLNSDVTGDSSNLDQEVYFGLIEDVKMLCQKYSTNPRYAQYGVTAADVLEDLKEVISEIDPQELEK